MAKSSQELYEELEQWLNSPEGKKYIEEVKEDARREEEWKWRWINKFIDLGASGRSKFIQKVVDKYSSEKYKNRWSTRGKFPPETLYFLMWEYVEKYGFEFKPLLGEHMFLEYKKVIDDAWVFLYYPQQQSFIIVRPMTDEDREKGPNPFHQSTFGHEYDGDWFNTTEALEYSSWCYKWADEYNEKWRQRKELKEKYYETVTDEFA